MHVRLTRRISPGAFTLIEMMVVIVIVVIVLAIVFPALSGARNAAKKAATLALLSDLSKAAGQFNLDNRRNPGYFTPADMGDQANLTRGFSTMENIMIDLAGGLSFDQTTATPAIANPATYKGRITVGPSPTTTVKLDTNTIGAASGGGAKSYFTPDAKNFIRQTTRPKQDSNILDHLALPDLVDAWGDPILGWSQDDAVSAAATFSHKATVAGNPDTRARFYWASNAAFLGATALGPGNKSQIAPAAPTDWGTVSHSLIGKGHDQTEAIDMPGVRPGSITGILGNPAYPDDGTPPFPTAPRGELVFHSAGTDGYFVSSTDRGGKIAAAKGWLIWYTPQQDPMDAFDDILVKGN